MKCPLVNHDKKDCEYCDIENCEDRNLDKIKANNVKAFLMAGHNFKVETMIWQSSEFKNQLNITLLPKTINEQKINGELLRAIASCDKFNIHAITEKSVVVLEFTKPQNITL